MTKIKGTINVSGLEPEIARMLALQTTPLYADQEKLLVHHSIAISLKRIADNLARDRHAVFTDHLGNPDGTIHTSVD